MEPGPNGLFDMYKLAVEMADRVSARRSTANAFYLTAATTLLTVQGTAVAILTDLPMLAVVAPLAGLGLCIAWWFQLMSYRRLNAAKFTVILALEKHLPATLFGDEWVVLRERHHVELGTIERSIPLLFALLFSALAVGVLAL